MKYSLSLVFLFTILVSSVLAEPTVVQMASAKTPDCDTNVSPCFFRSLTVSFAPTGANNALIAQFFEINGANLGVSCIDNLNQEWFFSPSGAGFSPSFDPPGVSSITAGLTSLTC